MPNDLFNRERPDDWSLSEKREKLQKFSEKEVVGPHCDRCQYSPEPVIKRGSIDASVMVVGDYTAAADQRTGKPFSGPAGELLQDMLESINLDWERDCYITNALLCDGTSRGPRKASVEACNRNLSRQLEIVFPDAVLAAGKYALQSLYRMDASVTLSEHTGHQGSLPGFPSIEGVVTFNPAYVLRQTDGKAKRKLKKRVWEHLRVLRELLQ